MTPEGRVKAEIKKWLTARGAYFFMPVQGGYGAAGLDFYVCLTGFFVAVEAKRPGEEPTPRQEIIMDAIRAAGGLAICAHSAKELEEKLGFTYHPAIP